MHLAEHFPKVQFIETAHSPLMAQVSLDANLIIVQNAGDHALICSDPDTVNDWRLDQVVTSDLFGLRSACPPRVEKIFNRRQELAEKGEKGTLSKEEHVELEDLKRRIRNLPAEMSRDDQAAMDIIRRAAETLRGKGEAS